MTPAERLELQQLLQLDLWSRRHAVDSPADQGQPTKGGQPSKVPESWELTRDIELHPWQEQCVDQWFTAGKRGVLKVVTGAGKTILALAIADNNRQTEIVGRRLLQFLFRRSSCSTSGARN